SAATASPVAFGDADDDLVPAGLAALRTLGCDVPFVRAQRPARGLLGAGLGGASPAQPPKLVERTVVVWKGGCAGLAGDPVDVLAGLRVENLLAGEPRRARAMTVGKSAQDDFGSVGRQAN